MKSFKFLLLSTLLLSMTTLSGYSQDKTTKYTTSQVYNLDVKTPKTEKQQIGKAVKTTSTAIYKEKKYSVYLSKRGKLFIVYSNKDKTGYNKKYIN